MSHQPQPLEPLPQAQSDSQSSSSASVQPRPYTKRRKDHTLTEEQKKKHHIESEHKRREAIRDAFLQLTHMVPALDPTTDSRSEQLVMDKTYDYLMRLYDQNAELVRALEAKGVVVDESLKIGPSQGQTGTRR